MSAWRPRAMNVAAVLLMATGLVLLIASFRIETTHRPAAVSEVPTMAAVSAVTGTPAASEPRATQLIERAQRAHRNLAYDGVKVLTRWTGGESSSVVLSVEHVPGAGTYVAVGDQARPARASDALTADAVATEEKAMLATLVRNYRLRVGESDELLDRSVATVHAMRADGSRAACFWIDRDSGLVLRRELVDPRGRVTEAASFMRIDLPSTREPAAGASTSPSPTSVPPSSSAGEWMSVDAAELERMRTQAWPAPERLGGGLSLFQVRQQTDGNDGAVVQLGYTDGLVAISVFVQRGALDHASLDGYAPIEVGGGEVWARAKGAPFYVWQSLLPSAGSSVASVASPSAPPSTSTGGDQDARAIVVSATTDSPSAPVAAVVAAFPALEPTADGVGERFSRGVQRVSTWFDPSH